MANTITTVSELLTKAFDLYSTWLNTRDAAYARKKDKKLARAVDAGESYILCDIDPDIDDEDKYKRKEKLRKLFFKLNN